jgi:hypothetical protein
MKVKLIFAWYDLWIGLFWDKKKKWLYIFPIPMFGVVIKINPFYNWMEELKIIAFNWSPKEYPLESNWELIFWKKYYYERGLSPKETWKDYTKRNY